MRASFKPGRIVSEFGSRTRAQSRTQKSNSHLKLELELEPRKRIRRNAPPNERTGWTCWTAWTGGPRVILSIFLALLTATVAKFTTSDGSS